MIQVGGTITAACAPRVQVSSMCCSMKQVTLLWYCKVYIEPLTLLLCLCSYSYINTLSRSIYRLFTPRAANSHDVFIVEELLLETLSKEETICTSCRTIQYNTIQYNSVQSDVKCKIKFNRLFHIVCTSHPAASCGPSDALQYMAEKQTYGG